MKLIYKFNSNYQTRLLLVVSYMLFFFANICYAQNTEQASNMRDPTLPQLHFSLAQEEGDINVSAIFEYHKKFSAVINGKLHSVGDTIAQYKIIEISPNNVLLLNQGNNKKQNFPLIKQDLKDHGQLQ